MLSKWIRAHRLLGLVGLASRALFPRGQDPRAAGFAVPGKDWTCADCGVGGVAWEPSRRRPRRPILVGKVGVADILGVPLLVANRAIFVLVVALALHVPLFAAAQTW